MPKVTVIVPIYNVESYLPKCIKSICTQTLTDIEIILIDDGSTDGSGNICDEYSKNDRRIRVIHKVNEGLSASRNRGIEVASAQYIMFVDGDDWVESDFCEIPYDYAQEYDSDIVLFKCFNHIGDVIKSSKIKIPIGIVSEQQALYFNTYVSKTAWTGLYKKTLFNNLLFPVGKYYEDVAITYKLIHKAKVIAIIDKCLYHYTVNRPGSITTSYDIEKHHDERDMYIQRIADLCAWGYKEYAIEDAFELLVRYGCESDDQQIVLSTIMDSKLVPEQFNWRQKIMIRILRKSPLMFDLICMLMKKRRI